MPVGAEVGHGARREIDVSVRTGVALVLDLGAGCGTVVGDGDPLVAQALVHLGLVQSDERLVLVRVHVSTVQVRVRVGDEVEGRATVERLAAGCEGVGRRHGGGRKGERE